jgi:methyl-accepting chemotaxis protein
MAGLVLAGAGIGGVYWSGGAVGAGILLFYGILGIVVAVVPGILLSRSIIGPLGTLEEAMASSRNDGDLSRRVQVAEGSSVAPAARAYNDLLASFRSITSRIIFNAHQLAEAAERLIRDAEATVAGSQTQNTAAEAAAEAVAEMAAGVGLVAQHADEAAQIAQSAREHSARGAAIVLEASAEIERIARSVEQSAQVVVVLGERSESISGIVRVIHEIADQTNLLALNAAIEAARAGEQGRGFAVVADEVRKLAERTTAATREISTVITAIQSETQSAIGTIREGATQARHGASLAKDAADALEQINQGAQETMEKVGSIARAMAEQHAKTQDIAEHVSNIMGIADSNSDNARSTLDEATRLDSLAVNLEEVGTVFRLGADGDRARDIHGRMPGIVQEAAAAVAQALEAALDRGELTPDALFDTSYVPIANTKPQKFNTKYDAVADRLLPAVQEPVLNGHPEVTYAIACDTGGYVPTHNRRFCQPLTGDEAKDMAGNRTKRVFADPVGRRCGSHTLPFLLQTYRRDTGEIMHDISAPVMVKGRHWGGFRIGYRTEAEGS